MAAATINGNAPRIAVLRKAPKHPETEWLQGPGPALLLSPPHKALCNLPALMGSWEETKQLEGAGSRPVHFTVCANVSPLVSLLGVISFHR